MIIKPIQTYGIPLWGKAAMSHINKIETMQAKIVNAPWYVINEDKEINDKKKKLYQQNGVLRRATLCLDQDPQILPAYLNSLKYPP